MGNKITVNDVFSEAWTKISRRVASYMPYKNYYNTQTRVIISNSFLSPIFSYLFRFYLMGEDFHTDAEALLTKWLVPASRFRYDHLTAPTDEAGLTQPLHDLIKLNLAALLRNKQHLPQPSPAHPRYDHSDGASLLHTDHIQRATFFFYDKTDTDPPPESSQRELYKIMHQKDPTPLSALADKFNNPNTSSYLGPSQSLVRATTIVKNSKSLPSGLPSKLRYHAFELIYNAVPTRMREVWRLRAGQDHPVNCPFCNNADETIHHLHTCPVSLAAASKIINFHPDRNNLTCLLNIHPDDLTFFSQCPGSERLTKLIFSLAIWRTRRYYHALPYDPANEKRAANEIARYFSRTRHSLLYKKNRKKRNKLAEKKAFVEKLSRVHPRSLRVFTDGSALGNPGPAGSGYYMYTEHTPITRHTFFSLHVPNSTNNKTELIAVTRALQHIKLAIDARSPRPPPIYIFVDNKYAINATQGTTRNRTNLALVREARAALAALSRITTVHIDWVPGHANIFQNEIADYLAKRGSRGTSTQLPPPRPHPQQNPKQMQPPRRPKSSPTPLARPPSPRRRFRARPSRRR